MQKIKQFKFIEDPEHNEEVLNQLMTRLSDSNAEVTFANGYARIEYAAEIDEPKLTAAEKGIAFTCGDCPMLEPVLNRNGMTDKRVKYGNCEHAEFGRTWKSSPACEHLYTNIKNGAVVLIKSEDLSKLEEPITPRAVIL